MIYVVLSYLSILTLGFCDNIRGPMYPDILREFGLSDGAGAYFFAMASVSGLLGGLSSRWVLRKKGLSFLLLFAFFLMFLCSVVAYLANSYFLILTYSFIFGLSTGFGGVAQNLLVQHEVSGDLRRKTVSGLHSLYGLASLLGPLLVKVFYNNGLTWRSVFGFSVLVSFINFAILFLKLPKIGVQKKSLHDGKKDGFHEIIFSLIVGFYVATELSVPTRLSLFVVRYGWGDIVNAANYVFGFFGCMLIGRSVFTFIKFKISHFQILLISIILSVLFYLVGLWWHPLFLSLAGLTMAPFFPMAMVFAKDIFHDRVDAVISKSLGLGSFMVILMHLAVGYVSQITELRWGLHVGLLMGFLSLTLLLYHYKKWKNFS